MAMKDPDEALVPLFKHLAVKNEALSREAGRAVFEDHEVVEIRVPGMRDVKVFPATARSHWKPDPEGIGQVEVTFAERFSRQYQQFKAQSAQTKVGTPLSEAPFLTEARRAELRAQNVYTVEALATVDGQALKNLGPGGRDMKNAAMEYIEESRKNAPNLILQAELEALRARNAILEEDAEARKKIGDAEFDGMSNEQLHEYITSNTGHAPHGSLPRKQLLRLAQAVKTEKVA